MRWKSITESHSILSRAWFNINHFLFITFQMSRFLLRRTNFYVSIYGNLDIVGSERERKNNYFNMRIRSTEPDERQGKYKGNISNLERQYSHCRKTCQSRIITRLHEIGVTRINIISIKNRIRCSNFFFFFFISYSSE